MEPQSEVLRFIWIYGQCRDC